LAQRSPVAFFDDHRTVFATVSGRIRQYEQTFVPGLLQIG